MNLSSTSLFATGSLRVGRVLLGALLRGLKTALLRAATAAAFFVLTAFAVDRLVLGSADSLLGVPLGVLYVLYVGVGALLGGYVGMAAAMERHAPALVGELAGVTEPLLARALAGLPLGEGELEPARLRRLAETELRAPRHRLLRPGAELFEYAALNTLRERVLALADALEAGEAVDARDAVAGIVRDGMTTGVAGELKAHWRRTRLLATALAAASLLALPVLALVAG